LVDDQGTAMSESTLCGECVHNEKAAAMVLEHVMVVDDWDGVFLFQDCTGNTELGKCLFCGAGP
jgi:hypothetical protein